MADEDKLNATLHIWADEHGRRQITLNGEQLPFFTKGELTVQHLGQRSVTHFDAEGDEPECDIAEVIEVGHVVMLPVFTMGPIVIDGEPPHVLMLPDLITDG